MSYGQLGNTIRSGYPITILAAWIPTSCDGAIELVHPILQSIRTNIPTVAIGLVALTAIILGYIHTCSIAEEHAKSAYAAECERVADRVSEKFANYATSLDSARAFVIAAGEPDRQAWQHFVQQSKIIEHNAGIFGLAFVKRVERDSLQQFVDSQRQDGYSTFRVYESPDADQAPGNELYIIAHHAPESVNGGAIGLDLATRRMNKAVYDAAAGSGVAMLSDSIVLAQQEHPNRGLVMALPVYTNLASNHNVESVLGWVAMPIGMSAFFQDPELYDSDLFQLRVQEANPDGTIVHQSGEYETSESPAGLHSEHSTTAAFGGKVLGLTFRPSGPQTFPANLSRPRLVLAYGSFFGLLVTGIAYYTHRSRRSMANRLVHAVNNARIGVWEWNLNRNTFRFSESYAEMLGYKHDELDIGFNSWNEFCHPDDIDAERKDIDAYLRGETDGYCNEHRVRTKDGHWLWVRDIGEIIEWNADGTPKTMLGVHINIQSLRDAMDQAQLADIAKNQFLTNMSHEIRTPLTAILGYTDLISEESDMHSSIVRTIRDNADLLLAIINDILDMSKIEAGKMQIESVSCDPIATASSVADSLRVNADRKDLTLDVVLVNDLPSLIQTDPVRLRQILFNLVGNAIKFTHSGGVTIQLTHTPERGKIEFRVIDTGIGMDADQIDKLIRFQPFTQGNTTTTREYGGSGLGLSISSSLVGMLGGILDFTSSVNDGSEFYFDIETGPIGAVSRTSRSTIASRATDPESGTMQGTINNCLEGYRVMVVDDGEDNRTLLYHHLERAGADVITRTNGRDCVADLRSIPSTQLPDLLILDIQMPIMDGLQTIQELQKDGISIPAIALTAHAGPQHKKQCTDAGFVEYMTKPFDAKALIALCRRTINVSMNRQNAA